MTNLLKINYFVRRAACGAALVLSACGKRAQVPTPVPTAPLPTAGIAGQRVPLFPLTLVAAEDTLHWGTALADRRVALDRCDSIIGSLLAARAPEVSWVAPAELRRAARRAVGIAADPDQMGTSFLRAQQLIDVPDPLRYQLRTLVGLTGGRFALVPAGLVFRRNATGVPEAELSLVLVDSRVGKIGWRTVARGQGDDPWTALTRAVKSLNPGLP